MPDRLIPPRWRFALRLARAALYVAVASAGAAALLWSPVTIVGAIGEPLTYWWAVLCVIGSLAALVGVIVDKYRLEWIAVWPAAGGVITYAATVWGLVSLGETGRTTQAYVVTALAIALAYRGLELAAHAAKLRAEHHQRRGWWRA